ncbi:hypothetical protein HB904_17080 [Listeria booriae]|uniref:Mga helix-turn-helix domain-containing protein n=1 Tax=Listeria booriae TaxID=1552123 RepID=A0A842AM62_9LIST|nr:helix-turn-helix domain-containing protein [Listeria booriae]MBC1403150.1 hypothetical protein [Listeria booriae]MBC1617894.1 hypothetical protein [Listeria booriae]
MRELLEKKFNLYVDILLHLEQAGGKTVLFNIEKELHVSKVTLANEVHNLNNIFHVLNIPAEIIMSKRGLLYQKHDTYHSKELIPFFMKESILYKYLLTLIAPTLTSTQSFCVEQHISVSYFYKQNNLLKQILKKYHISINTTKNCLLGEEKNIRSFLFTFFWTTFLNIDWPHNILKEECESILNTILGISKSTLSMVDFEKMLHIIAITNQRILSRNFINKQETLLDISLNEDETQIFKGTKNAIFRLYSDRYSLSPTTLENEIKFFYTLINTHLFDYEEAIYMETTYNYVRNKNGYAYQLAEFITNNIYEYLGVDLSTNFEFKLDLIKIHNHMFVFPSLPIPYDVKKMKEKYLAEYPTAYYIIVKIIKKMEKHFNLSITKTPDNLFLEVHYILLLCNYLDLYTFNKKTSIYISCTAGRAAAHEITTELLYRFGKKIEIHRELLDTTDVSITECKLSCSENTHILYFEYPPSAMFFNQLEYQINQSFSKKNHTYIKQLHSILFE